MTLWKRVVSVWALRSRDISVLWSLIGTGVAMVVLPISTLGSDPTLTRTLATVGVLFVLFGSALLVRAYRDEGARERARLDADSIRFGGGSRGNQGDM